VLYGPATARPLENPLTQTRRFPTAKQLLAGYSRIFELHCFLSLGHCYTILLEVVLYWDASQKALSAFNSMFVNPVRHPLVGEERCT